MTPTRSRTGRSRAVLLVAIGVLSVVPWRAGAAAPPSAAGHDAGTWDMAFEKGNRRCRLFLRSEARAEGFALAMPAGCHKAFPALATVNEWLPAENEHVLFKTEAGATAFDFGPGSMPNLTAVSETDDILTLTPISPALQDTLRATPAEPVAAAAAPDGQTPSPAAEGGQGVLVERNASGRVKVAGARAAQSAPAMPPTTAVAVAGNYAVLRETRDTGCMVTLEATDRAKGELKARLAPACRDQGITVFDPVGWALLRGSELVLTAKRGHTTALTRRDEKTWTNAPPHGAALVLKRL